MEEPERNRPLHRSERDGKSLRQRIQGSISGRGKEREATSGGELLWPRPRSFSGSTQSERIQVRLDRAWERSGGSRNLGPSFRQVSATRHLDMATRWRNGQAACHESSAENRRRYED